MAARFACAWLVGSFLYFVTIVATSFDGIITVLAGAVWGAGISAVCVLACSVTGLLLRIPPLKRLWHSNFLLAGILILIGFGLFGYALSPDQVKVLGQDEDGQAIKELGVTWLPGFLILLFAIANAPQEPEVHHLT